MYMLNYVEDLVSLTHGSVMTVPHLHIRVSRVEQGNEWLVGRVLLEFHLERILPWVVCVRVHERV